MGFGTDFTEAEQAQLAEINDVFDRLYPVNSTLSLSGASYATLRNFYVHTPGQSRSAGSRWVEALREINGEAVVRHGQNFRSTNAVKNRLLKWRITFVECEKSANGPSGASNEVGRVLGQSWMMGLVHYYKEQLERCFGELNIQQAEDACVAAHGGQARLHAAPLMDSEQLVTRCISGARSVVTAQMSGSPYFMQAVRTCREMVQALQMVQGIVQFFSSHFQGPVGSAYGGRQRRQGPMELHFSDEYLNVLRKPQWLFRFIFLFLGAMDLLQDPNRDTAILTGGQLDYAIHCIACLVGEVDGKRKDGDVKTTLNALVLGHVKNSCLSTFPPQVTLAMLESQRTGRDENEESAAAAGVGGGVLVDPLTRCTPLLQQLLVRYPEFMTIMTTFARRNGVEEWGVSVMLAVLFCWDTQTPPLPTATQVGSVTYHVPAAMGAVGYAEDEFASTVVYALARAALRPVLSEILSTSAAAPVAAASAAGGEGSGAGAEEDAVATAAGGAGAAVLSPSEQKLCALLLGLVAWLDSVEFPDCSRMTRWSALDVGAQVMRQFNVGRWCMGRVLKTALEEVITKVLKHIDDKANAPAEAAAEPEDPLAAVATPLLQYLLRVERLWHALTEHTIELDSPAMDYLREMGAKTLPKATTTADFGVADGGRGGVPRTRYETGLLADYRDVFYEAVQAAMKVRWPRTYADLLTDPLLHSIHVHLLHAESATQRGLCSRSAGGAGAAGQLVGGGGPTAPGRVAGVKRPPPSRAGEGATPPLQRPVPAEPEAVMLATKEDLQSALRLVRCIKNRDAFLHRYTGTVRERLLARPAPDVIADGELEKNKKRCEQEAEQFLATWLDETTLLKTVRELHTTYTPRSASFRDASNTRVFELSSAILDWRLWGDSKASAAATHGPEALPTTVAELHAAVTQSTSAAMLPFPIDVLHALESVEQRYHADHSSRMLRWDWQSHVFTTFTLLYPKENGRVTTVSGTLLLHRLFLAIAAGGRAGVELGTLARLAGLDEKRVLAVLRPCLMRDRLLVRVGDGSGGPPSAPVDSPSSLLSLNYEFTRPPNRPRGDFTYWPSLDRRRPVARGADQDATMQKRREIISTSIMQVMKQKQRISHVELFAMVREKDAKRFEVTLRNFKEGVEDLIGKDFMARAEDNQNEYVFRA